MATSKAASSKGSTGQGQNCAVINPYALADLVSGLWGNAEAASSILDATISANDVSWWRPITLKNNDGAFAMEISASKKYFARFGTAH